MSASLIVAARALSLAITAATPMEAAAAIPVEEAPKRLRRERPDGISTLSVADMLLVTSQRGRRPSGRHTAASTSGLAKWMGGEQADTSELCEIRSDVYVTGDQCCARIRAIRL
jgi:hypothetical protein